MGLNRIMEPMSPGRESLRRTGIVTEFGKAGCEPNGIDFAAEAYQLIVVTGIGGPSGRFVRIAGCGGGYMAICPGADGLSERRGSRPRCDERPAASARSRRKGRATLPGPSACVKLGTPARTEAAGPACLL